MNTTNNDVTIKNKSNQRISTKNLVLTGMFTAILCVMAQIAIPTPSQISFSFSLFAIFLIGSLLQPRYALYSVMVYVLLGAIGVPVFAGFHGGLSNLFGNSGGYIMAYPIMAFVTSIFYKVFKKNKLFTLTLGMLLSLFICYVIGTIWFSFLTGTGFVASLALCVFPYVLFDIIKIILAVGASTVLRKTAIKDL